MRERYDVIVIGGGHAGVEAAWAAASVLRRADPPGRVALVTMDPARIGTMSCNPAVGGLAKGQMVREIDALGGLMGLAIDATGIMFKMLNTSKGPAVRGPRAQADKYAYAACVQRLLAHAPNLDVIAGTVDDLVVEDGRLRGIILPAGAGIVTADPDVLARADDVAGRPAYPSSPPVALGAPTRLRTGGVVLTTGTFMRALMHTGESTAPGGRVGEGVATGISATLRRLGFELGRLKTGTPPRLARESIDWSDLPAQSGDAVPTPFSDLTPLRMPGGRFPVMAQIECRVTSTNAAAHDLIRANLHRAPMYSGQIEAESGPRYCPSIEDKVVRFADRDSHHVFLEPESLRTNEIYCNGISTSLPADVQMPLVRTMPGCGRAEILKWGYAVEYDMIRPHQIDSTCMTKTVIGLFPAGQINGTSGYEEAGGQGLVAGLNAARLARGADLVRLGRDVAYIGVMLDDLVTKTPREPYRMFTSRAEHRLLLRADNADERLTPPGREWGLVDDERWDAWSERRARLDALREAFDRTFVGGKSLRELARRPDATPETVAPHLNGDGAAARSLVERVMTEAKYDGYIRRQAATVRRQAESERQTIPESLDPHAIRGLRREAADVLARFRPRTMGQASRLAGVNPADLTLLAIAIERGRRAPAGS
ncbi:MAG: tRNA uridine-5-carboxymethylaminomethyl(34) synthesis enzyme MnmG [Phycisphaerales bacterium]|nr:tRNA uridine-5-carboxymethylaminomethyl(34) synthesis enzyme MnmG [Phycisphaerales bacterium]